MTWINLDDQEKELIASAMSVLTIPEAKAIIDKMNEPADPVNNLFIEAAQEFCSDGENTQVDDDAVVSISDEGAYVMAWVWVSNKEAGITVVNLEDDDE